MRPRPFPVAILVHGGGWSGGDRSGSDRPIFSGRDAVIRYRLAEIEAERRAGYRWYVDDPRRLLERDYPNWAARWLDRKR